MAKLTIGELDAPTQERFWSKVDRRGEDECWLWTAGRNNIGYGQFYIGKDHSGGKVSYGAHRVAWMIQNGEIPEGWHMCHKCDVPRCCNPAHLFPGTPTDNVQDMMAKGRSLKGIRNVKAKLSEDQIRKLRAMARDGVPYKSLRETFGISRQHVARIVRRAGWKHI